MSSPEEDDDKPVTLRPNRFRPQSGIRERLRTTLERQLEREKQLEKQAKNDELEEYDDDQDNDETFTLKPPRTRYFNHLLSLIYQRKLYIKIV